MLQQHESVRTRAALPEHTAWPPLLHCVKQCSAQPSSALLEAADSRSPLPMRSTSSALLAPVTGHSSTKPASLPRATRPPRTASAVPLLLRRSASTSGTESTAQRKGAPGRTDGKLDVEPEAMAPSPSCTCAARPCMSASACEGSRAPGPYGKARARLEGCDAMLVRDEERSAAKLGGARPCALDEGMLAL